MPCEAALASRHSSPSREQHAAVSFFDQPVDGARLNVLQTVWWRRPRIKVLSGVAPVALVLARTDETIAALADIRGYPTGFVFMLSLRWRVVSDRRSCRGRSRRGAARTLWTASHEPGPLPLYPRGPAAGPAVLIGGGGIGGEGGRLCRGAY